MSKFLGSNGFTYKGIDVVNYRHYYYAKIGSLTKTSRTRHGIKCLITKNIKK